MIFVSQLIRLVIQTCTLSSKKAKIMEHETCISSWSAVGTIKRPPSKMFGEGTTLPPTFLRSRSRRPHKRSQGLRKDFWFLFDIIAYNRRAAQISKQET